MNLLRGNICLSRIAVCFDSEPCMSKLSFCQIKKLRQTLTRRISWAPLGQHRNQNVLYFGDTTSIRHQNVHCQVSGWSTAEDILLPALDWPDVCQEDMPQVAGTQWRQQSPEQPSEGLFREMGQWGSSSIKQWNIFCNSARKMIINGSKLVLEVRFFS